EADHNIKNLTERVARRMTVTDAQLLMFRDATEAMTALFKLADNSSGKVMVAGHASPDIEIAIDRADLEPTEFLGASPFAADPGMLVSGITGEAEIIYVANPNRITGAGFTFEELNQLARAVPRGLMILDEHYFDFLGITGIPLLNEFPNLAVVRSFTAGFNIGSESGFIAASPQIMEKLRGAQYWQRMSSTLAKIITSALANEAAQGQRLTMIHEESLRLSKILAQLGIQTRLAPADFLLLRVGDTKRFCNYMVSHKVPVENIDGYPGLKNYVRYVVKSEFSNDRFIQAIRSMPANYHRISVRDKRAIRMVRSPVASEETTLAV
ncbi:MAG: aminotransferase class I/II-fold pyridoxal phosphate-dependent enzyme, partial [Candidatus Zixiibacteriota bacterium]